MFAWISEKFILYRRFLFEDVPRIYKEKYSLRYPHGILRKLKVKYPNLKEVQVFVETGTFRGKTARVESKYFREVHTIELNRELYEENLQGFQQDYPNIFAYHGDSAMVLPEVLKKIKEPCLIFLDAHWSGDRRVDWHRSAWKGYGDNTSFRGNAWPPAPEQQCPLIDEAHAIGKGFHYPGLLVIDDWEIAGTRDKAFVGEDWSTISLDKILDELGRGRVVGYFETRYLEKVRLNIILDGQ